MLPTPQGLVRLDFSAVADAVGRLSEAGLVTGGGVAVMSLACIRTAMGDRWEVRRQQVWEHAERTLERALGPAAVLVRAGEDDLLVAQPGVERAAALGQALHALKEIITFFLGEVRPGDLCLRQVDSINGSELTCSDVPATLFAGQSDIVAVARPEPSASPVRAPAWKVFAGIDGAAIRVTCALDQLVVLKTGALAGCRLRPAVVDVSGPGPAAIRVSTMDWRDAERVDLTVLEQAAEVLANQTTAPLFVFPAAFSTLSSQRGRRLFMEQVNALADRFNRRVAIEIRDLRGVPASRLAEVVGLIRPACHWVLGEVEPDRVDIAAIAGCALNGLSVRPRRDWTGDARLVEQYKGLSDLARRLAPIALTRAFNPASLSVLASAGFTHATIGAEQMASVSAAA